jgi:hypothetical protein
VYHTTGFTKDQIIDLCVLVQASGKETQPTPGPPIQGLFTSIVVTLTYARRNRVQAEIAEAFGVSQPTISRAVTAVTLLLGQALADYVPVAEDLDPRTRYIVDGTLLAPSYRAGRGTVTASCTPGSTRPPGWTSRSPATCTAGWRGSPTRSTDAATTPPHSGCPAWSTPPDPNNGIGDKGYIGNDMITPIRKPADRELLDWEKEFNTNVNKIRYLIERTIANLKTWRILHTDYRRPLSTFTTTISTVIALHFYAISCE